MERHSCTANVITQYTDALTSRPNGLGSSGKDKKMTGQVLCQNFKCLVMRQKRPVMTDDRTLFPALHIPTHTEEKPLQCERVSLLTSFDKTSYSTFKVEDIEFTWMWNKAFYQVTIEVRHIPTHTEEKPLQCERVSLLTSFDKTLYSTFKVEDVEFTWMWNNSFCRMTIDVTLKRILIHENTKSTYSEGCVKTSQWSITIRYMSDNYPSMYR